MSSDRIARRNRANAQKSTGPKTSKGKAKVASNALRHGATAQPDPANVATWLKIILDEPNIGSDDLMPKDDIRFRALALAKAEARLVAAENALRALEKRHASVSVKDEFKLEDLFAEALGPKAYDRHKDDRVGDLLKGMLPIKFTQMAQERRDRRKLLKRYLSEARSKRRKAFADWLEMKQ